MNWEETLKEHQRVYVNKYVPEFAEKIKPSILAGAEEGYTALRYRIYDEDPMKHIKRSENFAKELEKIIPRVKVTYEVREKIYALSFLKSFEYYLIFEWGNRDER